MTIESFSLENFPEDEDESEDYEELSFIERVREEKKKRRGSSKVMFPRED